MMVAVALATPHWGEASTIPLSPWFLGAAAVGEAVVGAVIGLTIRVTLAAAEVAGNMCGFSMGQGFASSVDPNFGEQMLPVGRILSGLAILIFFALNGHHIAFAAVGWSLTHAPPGNALEPILQDGLLEIGGGLMAQGLRIASPIVGAMFIVQIGMGLVARSAPQVQIFSLTFAITSAVGAIVLFAAMPSVGAAILEVVGELPALLRSALGASS